MEDIVLFGLLYSYLGSKLLQGYIEVVEFLYKYAWKESPPLIRTISQLQEHLTSVEVEDDTEGIYNAKFLYYWGMLCLGESSNLIFKDLGTAETCFLKIKDAVPLAEARLAYINLLRSNEPAKSYNNIARLETLRKWANRHDLFSIIALAKISFYAFLEENREEDQICNCGLPLKTLHLLELPCQEGHPVAINFWNRILDDIGTQEAMNSHIPESRIWADILLDFNSPANMQIKR